MDNSKTMGITPRFLLVTMWIKENPLKHKSQCATLYAHQMMSGDTILWSPGISFYTQYRVYNTQSGAPLHSRLVAYAFAWIQIFVGDFAKEFRLMNDKTKEGMRLIT